MRPNRHSGEQIIATLKQQQAATNTIPISDVSFSNFKARFDGLEVSQARRLKALEDENAKLKKLLAEAVLIIDNARLKDLAATGGHAQPKLPFKAEPPARAAMLGLSSSSLADEA
jgi:putative transposase